MQSRSTPGGQGIEGPMSTALAGYIRVAKLDALKARGCEVVSSGGETIAVFYHNGRVYAVDNRCPHMGFPLQKGTVKDGILTCHWHHARFDIASGGTFDLFADDVSTFPVKIVNEEVWVNPSPPPRDDVAHWSRRLEDGLEHNIRLVIAKAVLGLQSAGAAYQVPLNIASQFGTHYDPRGWGAAMSILTCSANILDRLNEQNRPRALYQGLMHVGRAYAGKPPRFPVAPLPTREVRPVELNHWFRNFIEVRDEEGAERCLRTAIELGQSPQSIADMIFAAATDHIYLDSGHVLDFANKALELLDHIGWDHAAQVLTTLVHGLARATRSEELSTWRQPVDIASLMKEAREQLSALVNEGRPMQGHWQGESDLASVMLGDDPVAILEAIKEAIRSGAEPQALGSVLTYAAFLRMAHFHTSNEFGDWDTVHNTVTAANALHQALRRAPSVELLRGVFDSAISIYLCRFLNMPAQPLPETDESPVDSDALLAEILACMDRQQQVEEVAERASRYLTAGAEPNALMATLGYAMLREDADFHSFQVVDAAYQQYSLRQGTNAGRHVLIAMSRYLAAHSPTPRATGQTYQIALRLQRGEAIHQRR